MAAFTEQMDALVEGGVDVIWIETLSSREELDAAYEAATAYGLPIVSTMSFDTNGHTMMGFSPEDLALWSRSQTVGPAAVGANCGVGAGDVIVAVQELAPGPPIRRHRFQGELWSAGLHRRPSRLPARSGDDGRLCRAGDAGGRKNHRRLLWLDARTHRGDSPSRGPVSVGRSDHPR